MSISPNKTNLCHVFRHYLRNAYEIIKYLHFQQNFTKCHPRNQVKL